jgi:formate C-acetyltransferase
MTEYMKSRWSPSCGPNTNDFTELDAGERIKYILENKVPIIDDKDLLAGTTTTRPKGVIIYPDFMAHAIWPELETIAHRQKNAFCITREDIRFLNSEVFPYWMDRTILEAARREYRSPDWLRMMERIIFFVCAKPECVSHTIPDYGAVVSRGLNDLRQEAEDRERRLGTSDKDRAHFYQAVRLAICGVLIYARRLSDLADELARGITGTSGEERERKKELETIRDICRRVPGERAQSFQEALQAIWICKVALHQENANLALSLGRLDQVLYELYRQDIDRGTITVPGAVELVGCLWLKIGDHVPMIWEAGEEMIGGSGSNQAVTLGGVDSAGEDAVNDLTYVMLKATELLRLRDPNVNCRYFPEKNPDTYLHRLCEVNVKTGATPCFHNDVAAIESLQGRGFSQEHARDYAIVGCVEPVSSGRTFGHPGAIQLNLTAALEMSLFQGKHRLTEDELFGRETPAPEDIAKFEDFKEIFEEQLSCLVNQAVTANNCFGKMHQKLRPTPLLSVMTEGCMESGKDVIHGGAVYNSSGVAVVGLAEVVDSLSAIQEFVFQNGSATAEGVKLNWKRMMKAIRNNWNDYETLQTRIKSAKNIHKFGNDGSAIARANADYLIDLLHRDLKDRLNYRGGEYTVGYWTMTYHAGMGLLTRALPSGRKNRESLPSGITPVSGSAPDLLGCTNFVARLDHTKITNGQALNLKYSPLPSQTVTIDKLAGSIKGYMNKRGLQVQCNIIDRETLKDAHDHPKKHRELLVRVSGYTAYFKDLNPRMKDEIIGRAEYDLIKERQVQYPGEG